MTDAEIYDRLAGPYSRRCVEPCGECGGPAVQDTDYGNRCDTCGSTGLVFREDEAGREMKWIAIGKWWKGACHSGHGLAIRESAKTLDCPPSMAFEEFAWTHREGQSWQSELESFVSNWGKPSPDLMENDGRELKRLLRDAFRYWSVAYRPDVGDFYANVRKVYYISKLSECGIGGSEAAALRAAVEAMLGESE